MKPIFLKTEIFPMNKILKKQYNLIRAIIYRTTLIISLSTSALVIACSKPNYTLEPPAGIPLVQTRTQTLWIDQDGILWAIVREEAVEDLAAAQESVQAQTSLTKGKQIPALYNMSQLKSITDEAREFYYMSDESVAVSSAYAIVQPSETTVFLCNTIGLPMLKPKVPSKCFVEESEAYSWLQTFLIEK